MNLDEVGLLNISQVGPAATLVNPQDRRQCVECRSMYVQVVGQQLANPGPRARFMDGIGVPRLEEQVIGLGTGLRIAAEESGSPNPTLPITGIRGPCKRVSIANFS